MFFTKIPERIISYIYWQKKTNLKFRTKNVLKHNIIFVWREHRRCQKVSKILTSPLGNLFKTTQKRLLYGITMHFFVLLPNSFYDWQLKKLTEKKNFCRIFLFLFIACYRILLRTKLQYDNISFTASVLLNTM